MNKEAIEAIAPKGIILPAETEEEALLRRIKMHEFLMSGGVMTGVVNGIVTYSGPVDIDTTLICPWHGRDCEAWDAIVNGNGFWTKKESELIELTSEFERTGDMDLSDRMDELIEELSLRPLDAGALRSLPTVAKSKELSNWHKKSAQSKAPSKPVVYGNPGYSYSPSAPELDSRDDAVIAFMGEDIPDEIVIEGAEED